MHVQYAKSDYLNTDAPAIYWLHRKGIPAPRYDTRKTTMNTTRRIDIDSTLNAATGAMIALLTCVGLFTAFVG